MTLRRRLTLLVALTIVVPITAVGVTVVNLIGNQADQRAYERLDQAAAFAAAALAEDEREVERLGGVLARSPVLAEAVAAGGTTLDDALRQALVDLDLDIVVVAEGEPPGAVVAAARREPELPPTTAPPSDEELVATAAQRQVAPAASPPAGGADVAFVTRATSPGGGSLVVGRWLDATRLRQIARAEGLALTVASGGRLVASSEAVRALPDRRDLTGGFEGSFGGDRRVAVGTPIGDLGLVVVASSPPSAGEGRTELILLFAGLLIVLIVLIVLVGYVVSGLVTGPVEELADAARAVSRGDLDQRVEPAGDVELASLGRAFNEMTDNLRRHVQELEQSRHEFQAAMARLGDVLVSTHDIGGIIDVVLEACTLTLRADEALFFERVAMPARIRATAAQSWAVPSLELNGSGVAGTAARQLAPARFPGEATPAEGEPVAEAALAVPVVSDGRLFGVIAVYGRAGGGTFREEDVHTMQTLARQTEVAIGNVFLHDETRRQARTDGTTGLWNRREFELRALDSVKEATRFEEPFGIILVDIDNFKRVNDDFDHSTGDAALIWLASRLSEATREIDVVARWGGEEFIVLLPRAGVDETGTVAERIRATVAAEPMVDGPKIISLTVSIGMAVHPSDGSSADSLFKAADAALLRAKRLGKNRVERARPEEGAA